MRGRVLGVYDQPHHHLITGLPGQVEMVLRTAYRDGRLETDPALIAGTLRRLADGRVSVRVTLLEPGPPPKRTHPVAREVGVALIKSAALVAVLGALMMLAVYAVTVAADAVADAVNGRVVLGVLVAVLVLWLWLSAKRRHVCKGIHCDGCSRR